MSRKPRNVQNIRTRVRKPQDPVQLTGCNYCNKGFWYRPSMGLLLFNGEEYKLRIACGWCDKNNYVLIQAPSDG